MKMSAKTAHEIQNHLTDLCVYSKHPFELVVNRNFDSNTLQTWQDAVNLIYRLLTCGLIHIWALPYVTNFAEHFHKKNVLEYCQAIAEINPHNSEELYAENKKFERFGFAPWSYVEFDATGFTQYLVKKHGLAIDMSEQKINIAFIEELELVFESFNVPWSETPIVKILSQ